jgi:hypothetical protein
MGSTRTDLLETLSTDSDALKDLATSFRNRLRTVDVVTFYETQLTPPLSKLVRSYTLHHIAAISQSDSFVQVVDKTSAIMDVLSEEPIPLFANHLTMCRFSGETQEYKSVSGALQRLARKAHAERQGQRRKSISSERCT